MFNIYDNYWAADDGRVFGSAKQAVMTAGDADYVAWLALGNVAIPWPRDNIGNQTDAALQAVFADRPLYVNLKFYNANRRWRKEQGGIVTTAGFPIETDDRAQAKITGTYTAQNEVPTVSTPWHAADGTVVQLDAAGLYAMHADLLTHINACFVTSADLLAQIDAGTITTRAQIDAAYDAPMKQAQKDWMNKA